MTGSGEWAAWPAGPAGPAGPAEHGPPERSGPAGGGPPSWINVGIVIGVVVIVVMAGGIVGLLVTRDSGEPDAGDGQEPAAAVTTSTATTVDPDLQTVPVEDVADGMCFDLPPEVAAAEEGEAVDVTGVPVVDCAEAHDLEVYAVFDLEDGVWRGSETVLDEAMSGCTSRFEDFVGVPPDESGLEIEPLRPTIRSWEDHGDRAVKCTLSDPTGRSVGTLEGAAR